MTDVMPLEGDYSETLRDVVALLERLSGGLTWQFGRSFGRSNGEDNLALMRPFYQSYPSREIPRSTVRDSGALPSPGKTETPVRIFYSSSWPRAFPCHGRAMFA
ncbi:hypothetical protein [Paraburkholderia sp. BL6665CI2N2]|uniref:hypothetical protein n=1 Tax=Paraburkholderia sp. BL6665CI2N2 TaxID=1938806 RepID=UPI001065B626|nr:hypothetical protein [Paraburkholderia sp. BL6665CI2N2]